MNLGLLDGKSAIITGSARGIGRATAELFVSEGAKVLINDLDGDVAEQAAQEIDGETAVFAGDLTKPGTPDDLVKAAVEAFGQVDAVVNNAGYTWDGVIHKMSDEQFQAMLDIHTIVPFRGSARWRPSGVRPPRRRPRPVRSTSGRSSISPRRPAPWGTQDRANYSSAKAGVTGLTKTVAKEWGQFKINCNAFAFWSFETRLTSGEGEGRDDAGRRREHRKVPRDPRQRAQMASPERSLWAGPRSPSDAAGPVAVPLLSSYSNFIHGQVINVTGGQFTGMYS